MDSPQLDHGRNGDDDVDSKPRRSLPSDLPMSLDDRRRPHYEAQETEIALLSLLFHRVNQIPAELTGQSQFFAAPMPAKLNFSLDIDNDSDDDRRAKEREGNDKRLESMLAAQAAFQGDAELISEDDILKSSKMSQEEKRVRLQKLLNMAASNGEPDRVRKILGSDAKEYIDVDAVDEEGSSPLIYAACFGHEEVVTLLVEAGANVNLQDSHKWSPLTWAMTNRHKGIAKILLDHGASSEIKTTSGGTAFNFVEPHSDMSDYLQETGFIGSAGIADDFYDTGLAEERFEEQMQEYEMKRRMMMESSINLEVDLSSLGLDETPETPPGDEFDDSEDFVWDKCLPDQMFVFSERDLSRIIDIVVTKMLPARTPSQKPVPANVLFLSARFAHYSGNTELLSKLLFRSMEAINNVVEEHQWDMTILAFWISNCTLLLHYLRKDTGLVGSTVEYQAQLAELINEIYILIVRDAERRIDKVLDASMLDHETIPGFEEIHFQNEWRIFRSRKKVHPEPPMNIKRFRPPSPKRKAQPSPRMVTSLLSSTLFVLDLYDIHSVIATQILSQLFYWLSAELFNRIMSNRRYLARTKAMQIRMNISVLEEWARSNNRSPEHYEGGSLHTSGESTVDASRRHLQPVIQLLQWLQCFSSMGEDLESLKGTMEQMERLTAQQMLHAVKHYRVEVGEKSLSRDCMRFLVRQSLDIHDKKKKMRASVQNMSAVTSPTTSSPASPTPVVSNTLSQREENGPAALGPEEDSGDAPENLLFDPALMLPFVLPTSTDMLVTFGAGLGGVNRERERKYQPFLPVEFLNKLDATAGKDDHDHIGYVGPSPWDHDDEEEEEGDSNGAKKV
ncbi:Myosin-Va [Drechslerella dactyloides]|uniref:Myosin-Va n=1 Tax=Drechslerella dactyloides TaxID=74499 RepID=A0AAD6NGA4_DREDA|nr:Myosin-Va [Drechslerella dactyloides]